MEKIYLNLTRKIDLDEKTHELVDKYYIDRAKNLLQLFFSILLNGSFNAVGCPDKKEVEKILAEYKKKYNCKIIGKW